MMVKTARDEGPVKEPGPGLLTLLRELGSPPAVKSPEDAADEAAARIIASVDKERAEPRP